MKMYICNIINEIDFYLFGTEDAIERIDTYIDCHSPRVDIASFITRLINEKIKLYPSGTTLYGKLYVFLLKRRLRHSDILLSYDDYANLMFLSNPKGMQKLLGLTDEEVTEYKERLSKLYHVDNNCEN